MKPIIVTAEYLAELRQKALESISTQMETAFNSLATQRHSTTTNIKFDHKIQIEQTLENPIQLNFTAMAYVKQRTLIESCTSEIAWHGLVTTNEDRTIFTIHDILVYPQTVTATTVETDEVAYQAWKQKLNNEQYNSLRYQAHSHVNMGTSPSGVDRTLYDNILQNLGNNSFYIFLIGNKRDDMHVEIYDLQNNALYDNKDIMVTIEDVDMDAWYDLQSTTYLAKRTYTAPSTVITYPTSKGTENNKSLWQKYLDGEGDYPGTSYAKTIADTVDEATGVYTTKGQQDRRGRGRPPKNKK